MPLDALQPDWDAPAQVGALMSTRLGGVSPAPWATLNLGAAAGDEAAAVAENRACWARSIGATPVFMRQVHGTRVLRIDADVARSSLLQPAEADAAVSTEAGLACTVQVADCLPVLFAAPAGRGVAAAHAGWRGLAGGVLEATVAALCEAAACAPGELAVWLGPCIGPRRFEVGADVLQAFGGRPDGGDARFVPSTRPDGSPRWLADLPGLAQDRLRALGLTRITGGAWCTVEEASRFFSFRRDGVTGRLAASVWIRA
jgi:YfiH family protein